MSCVGCSLPDRIEGRHNIYVWSSPDYVLRKIKSELTSLSMRADASSNSDVLKLSDIDISQFVADVCGFLSPAEQAGTKILYFSGDEPSVAEYGMVTRFDELARLLDDQWLIELLFEGRYTSFIQPIVNARSQTKIHAYEFLLRGFDKSGVVISPEKLFEAARDHHTLFTLDRAARHSAVSAAARLGVREKLFINFMPGAIYDPVVCMNSTISAIAKEGFDPQDVVFEIVESDSIGDRRHLRQIVDFVRNAGFKVALDDFGAGFNNIGTFLELKPEYIKLDKQLTWRVAEDSYRREMVGSFIQSAHQSGTIIIAEGIEDQANADLLTSMGADYLQGYHIAYPAAQLFTPQFSTRAATGC